jgi:hypothetical protein
MSDTTFVAGTVVTKEWLNNVNDHVYNSPVVSIMDYAGVDNTGATSSSTALASAVAALPSGGQILIPSGTYLFSTAVELNDNIILIGEGNTSVLKGGITKYITAVSKENIEIRRVKFQNENYRVYFELCTNVKIIDCDGDGTRDSTNVTDQGFWFSGCDDVKLENNRFVNYRDAVYLDKNGTTPCGSVTVSGGKVWQTIHGSSINYPTGVYGVNVKELYIDNVEFRNIKASSDSVADGTGYGVYEGDGTDGNLNVVKVTNCSFIDDDGYTTRPMIGVLISVAKVGMVDNCYFKGPSADSYVGFIYGAREQTVQNCVFDAAACQLDRIGAYIPKQYLVANNMFKNIAGRVLRVSPNTPAVPSALIIGNTFKDCTYGPITLINVTYPQVIGNYISECNTSAQTSDSHRAGINLDGPTKGLIANNMVLNISTGACQYGFNVANVTNQVVVTPNNYFKGMTVAQTRNTLSAAPSADTWGVGDSIWNWSVAAGGAPGWVCTTAGTPGTWKAMASVAA